MEWLSVRLVLNVATLLLFGLFVVGFISGFRRYTRRQAAAAIAAAEEFLSCEVPALEPWQPAMLAELSDHWEGTRARARLLSPDFQRGTIRRLSQPSGPSVLAYYLSRKGAYAFLMLCTSEYEVRVDFSPSATQVASRGRHLGYVRGRGLVTYEIWDREGRLAGRYQRFGGAWSRATHGPVELSGRLLGEVSALLHDGDAVLRNPPRPAMRNLAPDLTSDEQDWLLVAIALELLHSLRRFRAPS
jgi:hypothetical protein